jgi:UDP-2-acetamido-2-deoxy-ribo-hexuluronate aminotransferase
MEQIQMVDLKRQYHKIKNDIDTVVINSIESTDFINGLYVQTFKKNLEKYLGINSVITCANGTDALQIAMMALDFKSGDEIICPAFTYVATAEVIGLLGLTPIMVDVDPNTFNIAIDEIEKNITPKTKAIVPVHLYGQVCDMESIIKIAEKYKLYVIEDNAQAIGAIYTFSNGKTLKSGTIGHIGCTSFFPSKNLGCFGDGGALMTNDDELAKKIQMIANHGQEVKYKHKIIGCNSRLDNIQAAVLNVKLSQLDNYSEARVKVAEYYYVNLSKIKEITLPVRSFSSTHVFHQFTIKVSNNKRDELQKYLKENGIPSMIYYPIPLYKQDAFSKFVKNGFKLENTEDLCKTVLSLPIHTEMDLEQLEYICNHIKKFFHV